MNFLDQWAGRIDDDLQVFFFGLLPHRRSHSVSAENQLCAGGNLVDGFDEAHAAPGKVGNDMLVMYDFVKHVDRRAVTRQGSFHALNGHFDPGTKTARFCQYDLFHGHRDKRSLEESKKCVNQQGGGTHPMGDIHPAR
jgi:hypothetical protein